MSENKVVPWSSQQEWIDAFQLMCSPDPREWCKCLSIIGSWNVAKLPVSVELTQSLLQLRLKTHEVMRESDAGVIDQSRLACSMAVVRAVNGLVDRQQKGQRARPVVEVAKSLGIPAWIVDIRHAATHGELPSLDLLCHATTELLEWTKRNYWHEQYTKIVVDQREARSKTLEMINGSDKFRVALARQLVACKEQTHIEYVCQTLVTEGFACFLSGEDARRTSLSGPERHSHWLGVMTVFVKAWGTPFLFGAIEYLIASIEQCHQRDGDKGDISSELLSLSYWVFFLISEFFPDPLTPNHVKYACVWIAAMLRVTCKLGEYDRESLSVPLGNTIHMLKGHVSDDLFKRLFALSPTPESTELVSCVDLEAIHQHIRDLEAIGPSGDHRRVPWSQVLRMSVTVAPCKRSLFSSDNTDGRPPHKMSKRSEASASASASAGSAHKEGSDEETASQNSSSFISQMEGCWPIFNEGCNPFSECSGHD